MSINSIVTTFDELRAAGLRGEHESENVSEMIDDVMKELEANSILAQNVLLTKINEEKLVKLMLMIQKAISTLSITTGGSSLLIAEMSGDLQAYTQTVILASIGTLIQEEIL